MKLVVDLPQNQIQRIQTVLDTVEYSDASEFVVTAIENQLELEESSETPIQSIDVAVRNSGQQEQKPDLSKYTRLTEEEKENLNLVMEPDRTRLNDGPLWGQYNRIFPIKLVVRHLANELFRTVDSAKSSNGSWISLEQFSNQISTQARELGLEIKAIDKARERSRGKKLSSALPVGDDPEKSLSRFKSHFIGYSDRNENLTGGPASLLFVNISKGDSSDIGLTKAGIEFANLPNPILDDAIESDISLSEEESEYYISHCKSKLKDEYEAILRVADSISNGIDRPDELTEEISALDSDWTEAQANTMRTGLVSRMSELGLLERERVGQRGVKYLLTTKGHELLELPGGPK